MINKENKVKLCYILLKLQKPKKLTKQRRNVTKTNQLLTIIINNYEM